MAVQVELAKVKILEQDLNSRAGIQMRQQFWVEFRIRECGVCKSFIRWVGIWELLPGVFGEAAPDLVNGLVDLESCWIFVM